MSTSLICMSESNFEIYREAAIIAYAEENVAAGRWQAAGALERSRLDYAALLPEGLATPDNFLYEIHTDVGSMEAQPSNPVGYLWFAVVARNGLRRGYVYDLEVYVEFRRQGHAAAAFAAMEVLARDMDLPSIELHVFANNPGARDLYAKIGYSVTGLNMIKHLT
jgi:ribosomal protein S18 acetylase RimI-like enzyme